MKSTLTNAFTELFPNRTLPELKIKLSNRFSQFNANVKYNTFKTLLEFHLSKSWRGVDSEILKGLFQSLLVKVYRVKKSTINIELYDNFVKNIHLSTPKTLSDPVLDAAFNRVNEAYFAGFLERPNLRWGHPSKTTLGTYDYKSDLITMSSILKDAPQHLLDYVMHHELLHKKFKFRSKNGRSFHHTPEFRAKERTFENFSKIDADLKAYLRVSRRRSKKGFFSSLFG